MKVTDRVYAECECGHDEFRLVIEKTGNILIQGTECVNCKYYQQFLIIDKEEQHELDS